MGEVYLAFDTALERPVAVKAIRPRMTGEAIHRGLLIREAQAQAQVVHPHVAQVYFAGEEDGIWFIAMQLADGGSLAQALAARGRLDWQEAARHMLAVAEGLAEAARLGIVHRDVKPANILLDRAGEAHVADFGVASLVARLPETAAAPADLGAVMGTFEYMAPEQLRGVPLDARADMYALGATFYHLLSGQPPLPCSTLGEAVAAHAGPEPRSLRHVAPRVPKALARVVDRCLKRDRERRYRSFGELIQALRRAAPPPELPARALARLVAWAFDLVPAALVLRETYATFPPAALLAELGLVALSVAILGTTPGAWLLRLRLWTARGDDPSALRATLRALVQCGWLLPLAEALRATYGSSPYAEDWAIATIAWLTAGAVGSLGLLSNASQALHDKVSGVRVLVDTR